MVFLSQRKALTRLHPLVWFGLTLAGIGLLTALSPAEKVLGANARIVYLHGVWVWASLAGFGLAALVGAAALLTAHPALHAWSKALGRTGLFFWITYLPISLWAMQTNWNGLFLAEPRFRLAVTFSVTGLLLQVGLTLLEKPVWASAGNILFAIVLAAFLASTKNVMHPPSPILHSNAPRIQAYFALLFALTLVAAGQVTWWWRQMEPAHT